MYHLLSLPSPLYLLLLCLEHSPISVLPTTPTPNLATPVHPEVSVQGVTSSRKSSLTSPGTCLHLWAVSCSKSQTKTLEAEVGWGEERGHGDLAGDVGVYTKRADERADSGWEVE